MLSFKFLEILKYLFCDGINHLSRYPGGGAQGGDDAECFHVYRIFRVRIELCERNGRLDVIVLFSDQLVNAGAGDRDETDLALTGRCLSEGLARMPHGAKKASIRLS